MNIKTKVIKTLVDKKTTRQDIYKAIYKAQGKEIPKHISSKDFMVLI